MTLTTVTSYLPLLKLLNKLSKQILKAIILFMHCTLLFFVFFSPVHSFDIFQFPSKKLCGTSFTMFLTWYWHHLSLDYIVLATHRYTRQDLHFSNQRFLHKRFCISFHWPCLMMISVMESILCSSKFCWWKEELLDLQQPNVVMGHEIK